MVEIEIRDRWVQRLLCRGQSLAAKYFVSTFKVQASSIYIGLAYLSPRGETHCLQFAGFQKRQSESLGQPNPQMGKKPRYLFRFVYILFFVVLCLTTPGCAP